MVRVKALDACDSRLDAFAHKTTVAALELTEQSVKQAAKAIGSLARMRTVNVREADSSTDASVPITEKF